MVVCISNHEVGGGMHTDLSVIYVSMYLCVYVSMYLSMCVSVSIIIYHLSNIKIDTIHI